MTLEGRRAAALLLVAVLRGVLGDILFYGRPLGLNVFLFVACFVAALAVVLRAGRSPLHQGRRWMALPLLVFGAAFAWHDSPLLMFANVIALCGAVSLGALRRTQSRPQRATVTEYAAGLLSAGAGTFAGTLDLLQRDVPWNDAMRGVRGDRAAAVARGAAIGAPFVLVFGGLFLAADAVFRGLAQSVVPSSLPEAWPHVLVIVAIAWLSAGLVRDLVAPRDRARLVPPGEIIDRTPKLRLSGFEVAIALATVNAVFLAFVIVQARYLFGGKSTVLSHAHLTYAQYARHGFFELLAVTALVVPVVLAANLVARDHVRAVRVLSLLLIALELVVAISALQRMRVYVDRYGLTELRIYATGVIMWLMVVLLWAAVTAVRGQGHRFAIGAIVAGFAATLALNVVDPDALIVRTNIGRGHVDPAYLTALSDDAVPTLVARLPRVRDAQARHSIAYVLLDRRRIRTSVLGWNRGRSGARAAIERHQAELQYLATH
jgi:Domain of unknown function (DUF4173)